MNASSTGLRDRATDAPLHESQVSGVLETGTLLFSSAPKLIYIDGRAGELCARINLTLTGCATNVLPLPVTRLCADIADAMAARLRRSDYSPFELRRFSDGKDSSVLLRGYGLPYPAASQEGRIPGFWGRLPEFAAWPGGGPCSQRVSSDRGLSGVVPSPSRSSA